MCVVNTTKETVNPFSFVQKLVQTVSETSGVTAKMPFFFHMKKLEKKTKRWKRFSVQKSIDSARTRTWNLWFRRPTRYPLRHRTSFFPHVNKRTTRNCGFWVYQPIETSNATIDHCSICLMCSQSMHGPALPACRLPRYVSVPSCFCIHQEWTAAPTAMQVQSLYKHHGSVCSSVADLQVPPSPGPAGVLRFRQLPRW